MPYYITFNRYNNDELQAFQLVGDRYQRIDLSGEQVWIQSLELGLALWQGEYRSKGRQWLRWCDVEGNWVPTEAERAERERRQKELAQHQAEQAQRRAEQAEQRAELERQQRERAERRVEELAQRLRDLGLKP